MAVKSAKAHWVVRDTIAWTRVAPSDIYRLYYSATGELANPKPGQGFTAPFLPLVVDPTGLPTAIVGKFPFLKGATALKISDEDLLGIPDLLKGELLVARMNELAIAEATSLQIAGVLDDLFYYDGALGAQRTGDQIRFRLWAPTARSVRLFVYDDPDAAKEIYPMVEGDSGVWEIRVGDPG